ELGGDPGRALGITPRSRGLLADRGAVLLQDPALRAEAIARADARAYSLIGITHSLASRESWQEIISYPTAPAQPWDPLGWPPLVRPARPIIPLGVDAAAFAPDPARRTAWRARHGIAEGEVVALFLGRLSLHAKAHPHAAFAAMEEAARTLPAPPRFFLLGQF